MLSYSKQVVIAIAIGLLSIFLYNTYYLVNGSDSHILIHDNLDNPPLNQVEALHEENVFYHDGKPSERLLNGSFFEASGINTYLGWYAYYLLEPFTAFLVNEFLLRFFAFISMFILLLQILPLSQYRLIVSTSVSVMYAFLPFYPPIPFTVPLLPLMVSLMIHFYKDTDRWYHWVLVFIIPFFTVYLVAPMFLFLVIGIFYVFIAIKQKHVSIKFISAFLLFNIVHIATDYYYIAELFQSDYTSKRVIQTCLDCTASIPQIIKMIAKIFLTNHYHVATYHMYILFPLILLSIGIALVKKHSEFKGFKGFIRLIREQYGSLYQFRVIFSLLLSAIGISVIYGLYYWSVFHQLYNWIPYANMVTLSRFNWLQPLIWYVMFAFGLCLFFHYVRLKQSGSKVLLLIIAITQLLILLWSSDYAREYRQETPTFKQFYAEEQFTDIADFIAKEQSTYRVASLGLHPSIASYNGFYTLDAYMFSYDIRYHKEFRKIIEVELSESKALQEYYDYWGSRCYLFSSELGRNYIIHRNNSIKISDFDINIELFRKMGGEYIFSSVEILNAQESDLTLLRIFDNYSSSETYWNIYLYGIESQDL